MSAGRVGVIGGGLAGIAAALAAADAGADVVLFERRSTLGGLTSSIERNGLWLDNGQHVFLRCCTAYRALLDRIGALSQVRLQPRLAVQVLTPGGPAASIQRSALPAPLHLARSLASYGHLSVLERARLGRAVLALLRLDLDDGALDEVTFGDWLRAHGQSPRAIERLWNLIVLPTVNVPATDASLALAAKVFREGLLDRADAGDIGWSEVPLAQLHGANAARALAAAGVEVRLGTRVDRIERDAKGGACLASAGDATPVDATIVATPPPGAASLGVLDPSAAVGLGASPIVNVHLVLDRQVTDHVLFAAVDSPVQFVFDRTASSGLAEGQCLAMSLSGADDLFARGSRELVDLLFGALGELVPEARAARLVDAIVTRERAATFRGVPGTQALRARTETAHDDVYLAGAWTATGWPATMEGAVRSGNDAARGALERLGVRRGRGPALLAGARQ